MNDRPSHRPALAPPLVMRCGALGDMVLLTVLLHQLHERFRTPVDLICSGGWVSTLLAGDSSVGRVFVLRSRHMPYWLSAGQQRLVAWLKARGGGPAWYCDRKVGRELLARGGLSDDQICDSNHFDFIRGESVADRYLRLGSLSPAAYEGLLPPAVAGVARAAQLQVSPRSRENLDGWLKQRKLSSRPFIVVHPGCRHATRRGLRSRAGISKYWPEERWAEVVRAVRARCPEHAILFTGTRPERGLNADIIRRARISDVHNVAGQLGLAELMALLERASSMIAVDTGPTHIAAALGRPTVALFGNDFHDLYRPGGATTPAVALSGSVGGVPSILGITPEAVIAAWSELTGKGEALSSRPADRG